MAIVGIPRQLFSKFEVRQSGSANLSATFHVGQDSADLFAKVNLTHSVDLFAKFELTQWADLKATFHVGQDSADLFAKLQITQWVDLKCTFVVSKANIPYADLLADFWVSFDDTLVPSQGVSAEVYQALTIIT